METTSFATMTESSQSAFNNFVRTGRKRRQRPRRLREYEQVSFEANSLYDRLEELLEYLYVNYYKDPYARDTNLLVRRLIDWLAYFSLRREDDRYRTEPRSSREEELSHSVYYASYVDIDRVLLTLATLSTRDLFECNRNILCKLRHWVQCLRSKYGDRRYHRRDRSSFDDATDSRVNESSTPQIGRAHV